MRIRDSDLSWVRDTSRLSRRWYPKPELNRRLALNELSMREIDLREKVRGAIWPSFSTNLSSRRLWLARGFWQRSYFRQAQTLGHELVHFRQREQHGDNLFNARYLFRPRWRWRYEVQAYRETIRIYVAQGGKAVDQKADSIVRSLQKTYLLRFETEATKQVLLEAA